jgi:polysaccharide deacetylase 2 family uncharacterized protein YibQ
MAKRKSTRKKKVRKKSHKKNLFKSSFLKAVTGIAILVLLVVGAGLLLRHLSAPQAPPEPPPPPRPTAPAPKPLVEKPPFEIYPKKEIPPEKPPLKPKVPKPAELPKVAIIIDDIGYDSKIAKQFLELDAVLTFSILPHSPFQKKIIKLAEANGFEIMLHLPMEPAEYPHVNPGPGTLLTTMSPDQLISQLEKNLAAIPDIKGVNNHMGSKMTAQSNQMNQIFSVLKTKGLYFIDSRTTAETLGRSSARLFQVPFAERDVFLDHFQKPEFIKKQIKELVRIARRNGQAVGIAHPHPLTVKILKKALPELKKEVQLVAASKIVHVVR